jgi:hypothetical protein
VPLPEIGGRVGRAAIEQEPPKRLGELIALSNVYVAPCEHQFDALSDNIGASTSPHRSSSIGPVGRHAPKRVGIITEMRSETRER